MKLRPLIGFQILPFLEIFISDLEARKLKVHINMDNDWLYCVYRSRGQGSITLGAMSLGWFSKN